MNDTCSGGSAPNTGNIDGLTISSGASSRTAEAPAKADRACKRGVYLGRNRQKPGRDEVSHMAAKDRISKVGEAARAAQRSRYLQRLLEDEDLRGNLITAYGAARSAYGRMANGKPATQALFEDRKLQRELKEAASAIREASAALREPPKRRRGGASRALLVLIVAGVLAIALTPSLRSKVLDLLFGAEEQVDYNSSTPRAQATPAGATA